MKDRPVRPPPASSTIRPYTDYVAGQGNNDRRRTDLMIATDSMVKELGEADAARQAFRNAPKEERAALKSL